MSLENFRDLRREFVNPDAPMHVRIGQRAIAFAFYLSDVVGGAIENENPDYMPTAMTVESPWDAGAVEDETELDAIFAKLAAETDNT